MNKEAHVCRGAEETISFLCQMKRRRDQLIGYILCEDKLMKRVIKGIIERRNHKRRPCLEYNKQILTDMIYNTYWESKREEHRQEEHRQEWRTIANQPGCLVLKRERGCEDNIQYHKRLLSTEIDY